MQEEIDRLEAERRIFVIRPQSRVTVSRVEQDVKKLENLYKEGREYAVSILPKLMDYLQ